MSRLPLLILLPAAILTGCSTKSPLPTAADDALKKGTDFQLISLEPEPLQKKTDDETWYDKEWVVLGQTEITDADTRQKVISSVEAAIREHNGEVAACFEPRHVIAVQYKSKSFEFEICFKCRQIFWYIDRKRQGDIYIGENQKVVLDAVLKEAGVTLARAQ